MQEWCLYLVFLFRFSFSFDGDDVMSFPFCCCAGRFPTDVDSKKTGQIQVRFFCVGVIYRLKNRFELHSLTALIFFTIFASENL
jgi:hypothetical protein